VVRAIEVRNNRLLNNGETLCEEHADKLWEFHLADYRIREGSITKSDVAPRFELELILADQKNQANKVLLRELGNNRLMFFPIGYLEFCVLAAALQESPYNEWTLHVALAKAVKDFGGELCHVIIDDFHPEGYITAKAVFRDRKDLVGFYVGQECDTARAVLRHCPEIVAVQIRPSDGLALGILTGVPFLVAEKVLARIKETGQFGRA